jgi:hypothetical protein
MNSEERILKLAETKGKILTRHIVALLGVSRQYANLLTNKLVSQQRLIKIGSTRNSVYILPEYAKQHHEIFPIYYFKTFKNILLEEHKILEEVEKNLPILSTLSENVSSIFSYAFSEMLNNAIEHSQSALVSVEIFIRDKKLSFIINDSGIGVFKSIQDKKQLNSELEAIQELLKGKTTTKPRSHSGEGIFFTSKAGDRFILDSYNYQLLIDNILPDIFVSKTKKVKKGTKVTFEIATTSSRHLIDVFNKYTNIDEESDCGFDKTEVQIKLYTMGGVYVSRSQARRVLSGLEKFRVIVFDYDKVLMIGQAFADELYRVFHVKYPLIKLEDINMNETVSFMVRRARAEAQKALTSEKSV